MSFKDEQDKKLNSRIKTIFSVENSEVSEEVIFMIKEKLFENQNSKTLKKFGNNSTEYCFQDIQTLRKLIEKIYSPTIKDITDFSKTLLENCVIVRNISDHVDEEILFTLFSQGFFLKK